MAASAFAQRPSQQHRGRHDGIALAQQNRALRQGDQRWREMSPADRQQFRSNIQRWQQLPQNERRDLRAREITRQRQLQREAEAAMRDAGVQVEAARRAQFEQRYLQERRRVEQELRRELQEKRQREMAPVVERLKKEFAQPSAAPSARPNSPEKKKDD
ncbi:MAG: hypothetical protein ABIR71_01905 [Chthoniobacterales bacterium]